MKYALHLLGKKYENAYTLISTKKCPKETLKILKSSEILRDNFSAWLRQFQELLRAMWAIFSVLVLNRPVEGVSPFLSSAIFQANLHTAVICTTKMVLHRERSRSAAFDKFGTRASIFSAVQWAACGLYRTDSHPPLPTLSHLCLAVRVLDHWIMIMI